MKKILLATLLFVFATSTNAFAHTHLGSSSPADGQVVTEELSEITLNFEGKIEQSSSFELSNSEGQNISIEEISINEGIMSGTVANPLENGEYLINWSIIGADGHLMEGEYSFTVNVTDSNPVSEALGETEQAEEESTQEVEQNNEQATSEQVAAETEDNEKTSPLIPVIIIVLLVVIIGSVLVMRRKK
ncbi:copper resistance protein CopC [Ureibacillus sp. GCM10028918]|uniref:copper resistance CopC family protein n=1 Tax=Ureibacillus sp. GCM10028918 TaxID=3273429 RepID=UPI00361B7D47